MTTRWQILVFFFTLYSLIRFHECVFADHWPTEMLIEPFIFNVCKGIHWIMKIQNLELFIWLENVSIFSDVPVTFSTFWSLVSPFHQSWGVIWILNTGKMWIMFSNKHIKRWSHSRCFTKCIIYMSMCWVSPRLISTLCCDDKHKWKNTFMIKSFS